MGCFDTVGFKCDCGEMVYIQSKSGDCELKTYDISYVPLAIAGGLKGATVSCCKCGKLYELQTKKIPEHYIKMRAIPVTNQEEI